MFIWYSKFFPSSFLEMFGALLYCASQFFWALIFWEILLWALELLLFFFFSLINKDCWSKVFQNLKGQKTKCHSKARNKTFAYLRHWFSWCNIYIFNLVSSRSPTLTHWRQNVRLIELIKKGSHFSVEYLLMIE